MRGVEVLAISVLVLIAWAPQFTEQKGDLIDYTCLLFSHDVKRSLAVNAGHDPISGKYKVERPQGPCSYDLARHHIIPNSELLRFFRLALRNANQGPTRTALIGLFTKLTNAAVQRMAPAPVDVGGLLHDIEVMDAGAHFPDEAWPLRELHGDNEASAMLTLRSFAEWMPFNFFRGPSGKNRVDDAGDQFEDACERIVGDDNLNYLRGAYQYMRRYIATQEHEYLAPVISIFEQMLDTVPDGYRPYTPSDWMLVEVVNGQCKFRLKRGNESRRKRRDVIYDRFLTLLGDDFSDPYCLATQINVLTEMQRGNFWFDRSQNDLLDLKAHNLVSTKKILDAVEFIGLEEDDYWSFKTWIVISRFHILLFSF